MSDNIDDTDKRFEIYVPSPKARINLGKRNTTDTGPFGYNGLSLQSDVDLFIDANKNTLYQTGQSFCGQVGGQWRQFSNDPMFLSATNNVTLAADNRVIIASGAGQGQITALDHGQKMRLVPYNELKLHYVVDALQVSLFEFFNGRHTRHEASFRALLKSVEFEHFFSRKNRLVALTAEPGELLNDGEDGHQGGFLEMAWRSYRQMEQADDEDAIAQPGDPIMPATVPWLAPILEAGIAKAGDGVLEGLKYGYSGYLKRFDPYAINKDGWLNKLHRVIVEVKRYFHVALKYGELVTDLPFIRNAIKGLEAVGGIVSAAFQAYHAATDSYPALATFERQSDGSFEGGKGGVVDEFTSGAAARVGGVVSSTDDTRKAKVTSASPPIELGWPLDEGTTYVMNVAWDGGSKRNAVRISRSGPAGATMSLKLKAALSSTPETGALSITIGTAANPAAAQIYDIPLTAANTGSADALKQAIEAVIPATEAVVFEQGGALVVMGSVVDPGGSALTMTMGSTSSQARYLVSLTDTAENRALAGRIGASPDSPAGEIILQPPRLHADGEHETVTLTIDGTAVRAELTATTTLHAALSANSNTALLATLTGSGNEVTLTTRSQSSSSKLMAAVQTVSRWTITASNDERGLDAFGATITAADIVGLLGSLDGASASVDGDKLAVEATKTGEGSEITLSGNLADLVFGSESKRDEIKGAPGVADTAGFPDVDTGFKTLVSWNHELQKLPEDTRNLTRPLTDAIDDTLSAFSALEGAAKSFAEVFEQGAPPPPEAIGLLSPGGITLGTQDRIVGSGGKGIVFISDGGTGSPDRAKFVATEGWVADIGEWSKDFFEPKSAKEDAPKRSLGFRVLSDSAVDLAGTSYAQLAALGRGTATVARPDGRQASIGIGIARVLGSYAAEVAGFEKVVISARNPGDAGDVAGATGGRVEVLGQRVVLGAVTEEHTLANHTRQAVTDRGRMGTESLALEGLDGAEHLAEGVTPDKDWIAHPLTGAAWTANLRALHPDTTHVDMHATTQIDQVVLPFRVQLTKEKAKVGIVTPVEADRRTELADERDRLEQIKTDLEDRKSDLDSRLTALRVAKASLEVNRDSPMMVLASAFYSLAVETKAEEIARLDEEANSLDAEIREATTAFNEATQAHDDFSNDWDEKAFPLLELTEDSIKFGFVAGNGEWEDFAYMELTKEGIKMFQPKSGRVSTFDLADKAGFISDGTKDTVIEANNGALNLKFKNNAKSGPLTWDAQGNVKIG